MAADISVRLVGLRPNATYLLQRAQEGVGGRQLGIGWDLPACPRTLPLVAE